MNHDDNKTPDLQAWIEPELEARMVAAVLGEASAFETAELERLAGEKPELAIFKRRIEAVHGLVGLAVRTELAPLRLAPERRAKILQTIGAIPARPVGAETNAPVLLTLAATRRKRRKKWIWASGLAASVMFAAFMGMRVMPALKDGNDVTEPSISLVELPVMRPEPNVAVLGPSFDAPREIGGKADGDVVMLSPFEVSKKPSMLDKLRKSLTSAPPSQPEAPTTSFYTGVPAGEPRIVSGVANVAGTWGGRANGSEDFSNRGKDAEKEITFGLQARRSASEERQASARHADSQEEAQRTRDGGPDFTLSRQVRNYARTGGNQIAGQGAGNPSGQLNYPQVKAATNEKKMFDAPATQPASPPAMTDSIVALEPFKVVAAKEGMAQAISQQRTSTNLKNVVAADQFGEIATADAAGYMKFIPGGKPDANKRPAASADTSFIQPMEAAANGLQPTAAPAADSDGERLVLSPFSVSTSKDKGYAATSTLSGTRLSTKLEDMASSISVVTKQQLSDSAAVDINDRFLSGPDTGPSPSARQALVDEGLAIAARIEDDKLSQQKAAAVALAPKPQDDAARGEIRAAKEPVSTFSLHVSDVSFRLAQAALARGETPDPERIRPEEFYNAFDYGDPSPATTDKISCRIEQAAHPLLQQRNLVRIAMKVPSSGRGAGQPLHLTVLLDTSGSMEREDRIASVHRALEVLASLLGANDRVTLIGFARQPRLLAEQLPGDQAAKLVELAGQTPFTGGTNLEAALKLAGELARRHRDAAAQNRVVLITDGAANLGNADPAQLATMIETLRQQGVAFDACGVGTDGLDDAVLEALTRKGDGRYYVLDKAEDADAGFARQLAGAFRPAAENVKVQVRFNPARVGSYRLIGFEQHRLREEDFRNDKVDAAELAADEAAVALYQVEVLPQGEGEIGEVSVRFRDAATGNMVERSWTMLHEPRALAFDRATPTMQLAGTAALLAEKLHGGEAANLINLSELTPVVNSLRGHYASDARVQELIAMFEQMRRRAGK